ncbi:right-handed parallel beta-helix repeat-containing protein [Halorussus halophilus]|uniref:right-handed parallel beta-helix repeat-containing protein n=1 Tax=Halorussus halophilus TaxID=2650975 RepID=UPI00130132B4|nr:right-handed parallel beta-helix repeat-containing protein [Halorussus halophilus]
MAGVAGMGLAASGSVSAHGTTDTGGTSGFSGFDTVHIVGDGDGMYTTIQGAHDDLPGDGAGANGAVVIADSYDSSDEQFPVVVDGYADIRGMSNTGTVIYNGDSTKNTFVFTATEQHNTESPMLSNVRLAGGDNAVVVEGHVGATVQDVTIWGSNTGIKVTDNSYSQTCYDNYFRNICISGVEGDGVYVANNTAPHSLTFDNVNVYRAGQHGYNLRQAGADTVVQNSTIQHADDWGMLIERSISLTLRDLYFERNAEKYASGSGNKIDICFHSNGPNHDFLVQGCYFNGMNETVCAIHLNSGEAGEIRNCRFNRYDDGYLIQDEEHTDLNVARSTITTDGREAHFYNDGDTWGKRTRQDGIIMSTDLSTTDGKFEADKGIHDGSGSAPQGMAFWLDGQWVSQVDGSIIG